jgi:hypothetical protein
MFKKTNKLQVQKKNSYQENYKIVVGMTTKTAERKNVHKALHINIRIIKKRKNPKYIASRF